MSAQKIRLATGSGLVVLLVMLAYWPAVNNGFVWDDKLFLFNPEYLDPGSWKKILTSSFDVSVNYFRPLVLGTFIAELYIQGLKPLSFHVSNLALHAANTLLVVALTYRITMTRAAAERTALFTAIIAGSFYGIHPVTVEATAWISGRFDLMLTFFSLLLFYLDNKLTGRIGRIVAVATCFIFAALSKEMAAAMGLVLPIWHVALGRNSVSSFQAYWSSIKKNGDLYVYLAVIATGLLYLLIRYTCLGYLYLADSPLDVGSSVQRLLLVGKSVGWYMLLVLMPFITLSPIHYEQFPLSIGDPMAWGALAGIVWFAVRVILGIRKGSRQLWFFVAAFCSLLPVINIIPLTIGDSIIHERFLQFPLAMFVIAAAICFADMPTWHMRRRQLVYGALALVVGVGYFLNVRVTTLMWQDNLTLWYWTALKNPDSSIAVGNLSSAYKDHGEPELSLEYGFRGLLLSPQQANGWIIVGNSLSDLGLHEKAETYLRAGAVLKPKDPLALNNLGAVLIKLKRYEEAKAVLQDGLAIAPLHRMINRNLGILHLQTGEKDKALKYFQIAYTNLSNDDLVKDLAVQTEKLNRKSNELSAVQTGVATTSSAGKYSK